MMTKRTLIHHPGLQFTLLCILFALASQSVVAQETAETPLQVVTRTVDGVAS